MDRSEIEKISKALADETRLRIFEAILASKHMNCGERETVRQTNNVMRVLKRQADGSWKVHRTIWNEASSRDAH